MFREVRPPKTKWRLETVFTDGTGLPNTAEYGLYGEASSRSEAILAGQHFMVELSRQFRILSVTTQSDSDDFMYLVEVEKDGNLAFYKFIGTEIARNVN